MIYYVAYYVCISVNLCLYYIYSDMFMQFRGISLPKTQPTSANNPSIAPACCQRLCNAFVKWGGNPKALRISWGYDGDELGYQWISWE